MYALGTQDLNLPCPDQRTGQGTAPATNGTTPSTGEITTQYVMHSYLKSAFNTTRISGCDVGLPKGEISEKLFYRRLNEHFETPFNEHTAEALARILTAGLVNPLKAGLSRYQAMDAVYDLTPRLLGVSLYEWFIHPSDDDGAKAQRADQLCTLLSAIFMTMVGERIVPLDKVRDAFEKARRPSVSRNLPEDTQITWSHLLDSPCSPDEKLDLRLNVTMRFREVL